jgi:predicted kinase
VGAVDSSTDLELRDGAELRDDPDLRDGSDTRHPDTRQTPDTRQGPDERQSPETPDGTDTGDGTVARRLEQRLERLAAGHPSSPDYADRRGPTDQVCPLTDAEHAEHVAEVEVRLEDARAAGFETHIQYTIDQEHEVWSDERDADHGAIVEDLYARSFAVPCEGKAILAGGLPGAGKTTVLTEFAHIDLSQYLMINPDVIKEEMARRGLVPTIAGLSPMEASDLVHEEASHVAKRLANRAEAGSRNVIWDFTMSKTSSIAERVSSLREAGYVRVEGVFVDIPVDVSVRRADARHREGHDEFRAGLGFGGRHIAEATIRNNADADWGSGNRKNFEELKSGFDGWARYDNSAEDDAPVLVESHDARLSGREHT